MYIADFHIHSKYSRATSKDIDLETLVHWSKIKGLNLLGTGDITHPAWFKELQNSLENSSREGIYRYKETDFILTGEVCNIFDVKGRVKRIHNILFLSSFESADKLNRMLERCGDINADGRPILHTDAKRLVEAVQEADEKGFIVPAHIWTPYFSLFGSKSGFDSVYECFGDLESEIFAFETGLGSDPKMNRRVSAHDRFSLISNSDAHSPSKIGREANIFREPFDFTELKRILKGEGRGRFLSTIESFSERGKYYFDGHRDCKIRFSPEETQKEKGICPSCGRKVTIGVMNRISQLADRRDEETLSVSLPFKKIVPLAQIIGALIGKSSESMAVKKRYLEIIERMGSEFSILLELSESDMRGKLENDIIERIMTVRRGGVKVEPGYDGKFGRIEILSGDNPVKDE